MPGDDRRWPPGLPLDIALSLGPGRVLRDRQGRALLDRHQRGVRRTVHGLPPGLEFDEATGTISGTPRSPGIYYVTVTETAILAWPWSWLRRLRLTRGRPG